MLRTQSCSLYAIRFTLHIHYLILCTYYFVLFNYLRLNTLYFLLFKTEMSLRAQSRTLEHESLRQRSVTNRQPTTDNQIQNTPSTDCHVAKSSSQRRILKPLRHSVQSAAIFLFRRHISSGTLSDTQNKMSVRVDFIL